MNGATARTTPRQGLGRVTYPLEVLLLIVLLLAVAPVATRMFDLDPQTSYDIALETLTEKYGLEPLDEQRNPIKEGSGVLTISEFRAVGGSVTEDVPFLLDGQEVACTVDMPTDDPRSTTATCAPATDPAA